MEDSMIEERCQLCGRVFCNCPPEPDEPDYAHCTPECLDACYDAGEHDVPFDWEPDLNGPTGAERHQSEYKEKYA